MIARKIYINLNSCIIFSLLIICFSFIRCTGQTKGEKMTPAYKIFGNNGPYLVVINGGPGLDSQGFESLAKLLSNQFRVITYDQRGTGNSTLKEINSTTITLDLMVKDLEELRKSIRTEEWIILGHSFGGMLGSYYSSIHPEKVKALILSSTGGLDMSIFSQIDLRSNLTKDQQDSLRFWNYRILGGDNSDDSAMKRAKILASAYLYDKKYIKAVAKRLLTVNRQINGLVIESMYRMKFDLVNEFDDFEKPVLVIQGGHDVIPLQISKETSEAFPNSLLKVIKNCGHYGWLENQKEYVSIVLEFLNEYQNKPGLK